MYHSLVAQTRRCNRVKVGKVVSESRVMHAQSFIHKNAMVNVWRKKNYCYWYLLMVTFDLCHGLNQAHSCRDANLFHCV